MILHGSLVLGDYVPGRSDVDLLLVVNRPLTDAQHDELSRTVESKEADARGRVDLRVVTSATAGDPVPLPPLEAYVAIHPGRPLHAERRIPAERDLVIELSVCRAHGRSLVGAEASSLIVEVPDEWVVAVGDAQLADWQAIGDDPDYAEHTVITTCRIWRFAVERRHCSKAAAAEWALERGPSLEVVRRALDLRHGVTAEPLDPKLVADLLSVARERTVSNGR